MRLHRHIAQLPLIEFPKEYPVFDLTHGKDKNLVFEHEYGIGRYSEDRSGMYEAPQYQSVSSPRCVHMGVDFFAPERKPVYSPLDGIIFAREDRSLEGDYGPTIITKHHHADHTVFLLFGHLARDCLRENQIGQKIKAGHQIGWLGSEKENGNWPPHLHFQISKETPKEVDMPGVVRKEDFQKMSQIYPDPRTLLGPIY